MGPLDPFLKREVFYFFGSPFKSKIPPFLGRDLGGPCISPVHSCDASVGSFETLTRIESQIIPIPMINSKAI